MVHSFYLPATAHILIVTSVDAERSAIERGLEGDPRFQVVTAGVGVAAAAATTARLLAQEPGVYGLVVNMGIAGGFSEYAGVGSVVVATEIVAADLGAETPDGFSPLDELGFGSTRVAVDEQLASDVAEAFRGAGFSAKTGPVLTVTTVTGTAETASALAARIPGAVAEAMEGFGVALAARDAGLAVMEIRAISNPVGPRDRAAWKIKEALVTLELASRALKEALV